MVDPFRKDFGELVRGIKSSPPQDRPRTLRELYLSKVLLGLLAACILELFGINSIAAMGVETVA